MEIFWNYWHNIGLFGIKIRPANKLWGCRSWSWSWVWRRKQELNSLKCRSSQVPPRSKPKFWPLSIVRLGSVLRLTDDSSPSRSGWCIGPRLSNILRVGTFHILFLSTDMFPNYYDLTQYNDGTISVMTNKL